VLPAITVDEVKAVVPVPAESRVVTAHHEQKGRERVEVAFCFDRGGLEAAVARVTEKLHAAGWEVTRDATATRDSTDLHAKLGELTLAGMVRRGPWADCQGAARASRPRPSSGRPVTRVAVLLRGRPLS